jgi:hypothetical protein
MKIIEIVFEEFYNKKKNESTNFLRNKIPEKV